MENLQVNGFNGNPKTIDEFFIQKYEELEKENRDLKAKAEMYEQRCDEFQNTLEQIAEDFCLGLRSYSKSKFISFSGTIWNSSEIDKEKYNYYKQLFNLKEEGENEDEQ